MKLFFFETPNSHKPCAVAKHLNSPVEYVHVNIAEGQQKNPDFLAVNPNGRVPALEDGDVKLWESHAIMAYLAYKAGSDMWPSDPVKQIQVMKWLNWDTAHFSRHASRIFFENVIKPKFGLGDPVQSEIDDATGYFKQFATVLDDHLHGKSYILGDSLTIADFAIASFLPHAEEANIPLDGCSELQRWYGTISAIDAWREPWPEERSAAA